MKKHLYFAAFMLATLSACDKTEIPEIVPPVVSATSPTFSNLNPVSAKTGETIVLTGTNFSTVPSENEVSFKTSGTATVSGLVKTATSTMLTVEVPATASSGALSIKVKGTVASLAASFTPSLTVTIPPPATATNYTQVVTFAGGTTTGLADGVGTAATFYKCNGLLSDTQGNIYVSDIQMIRKITPSGVVTTLTGKPGGGNADGALGNATFEEPTGMAFDNAGNIIVADLANRRVRRINLSTGMVTTVAGTTRGYADGAGNVAKFENPNSVAVDANGNIFVADLHRIRKIGVDGSVTTYAGSATAGDVIGPLSGAQFNSISYLTFDTDGNLLVCDALNGKIKKIAPDGAVTTIASGLSGPSGIAIDAAKNMYTPEAGFIGFKITKITPAGVKSVLAGTGSPGTADGPVTTAQFYFPNAIAIAPGGVLYVAEGTYYKIRKIF